MYSFREENAKLKRQLLQEMHRQIEQDRVETPDERTSSAVDRLRASRAEMTDPAQSKYLFAP